MKPSPICVLAFYSESSNAENGFKEIRSAGLGRASLLLADGTREGPRRTCERYGVLRLEAENLIVVETGTANVEGVLARLRQTGAPAIFMVRAFPPTFPGPLRTAEPLSGERLRAFVAELAREHGKPGKPVDGQVLVKGLDEIEDAIETSRTGLMEAARLGHAVTTAAEWLLDNYYLVRTNASDVRRDLPKRYPRILPTLPSRGGSLRVAEIARELVAHTDHCLSRNGLIEALREYQTVAPLDTAELWAFPVMLRFALLQQVAQLAARISEGQQLREAAYLWANRLAAGTRVGPEAFQRMLDLMERETIALRPRFLTGIAELLQGEENALVPVQHWMEDRLQRPFTDLVSSEHQQETVERSSIANAFRSLRALAQIDFTKVFESVSLVHAELLGDPMTTYGKSDFATRDSCRRTVEEMSRWSGRGELEVARASVEKAASAEEPKFREVCYYLLDHGRAELESDVGAHPPMQRRFSRWLRRNGTVVYVGSIIFLTIAFMTLAVLLAWEAGMRDWLVCAILGALSALPLSELALQVVNAMVISLLPPVKLPKMNFEEGIPDGCASLVVIPMMLGSEEVARREVEKLEVRFLANREANLWFGLFADFMDAATPSELNDQALVDAAREGIEKLNQEYQGRFVLFHRPRAWSESEQSWIGRERKRGKLEELNAFLSGEGANDILIEGALPLPIRYVITLDADTQLPPGAARRMVEASAHPLNQVEIDPLTNIRKRGYTVIQPRVSITLPSATATRFARIFSDARGTDPYCQAVSDAHQDLFWEAIFHGKAIYDVRAFHTILRQRFPPETLLSHDLIEGAHVGVALASDIELFENLPLDYPSYAQRQHRWIRGDWQIASWIFPKVPTVTGENIPNPLSFINRWRIFDNLRRSLVPIASVLLLVAGSLVSRGPGVWSLVVMLAVAIPAIVPVLDRLARRFEGSVLGWRGALDELARALVMIAVLPHQALLTADAIARVIYRKKVSHRKLLEWQTAEAAHAMASHHASTALRQLRWIAGSSAGLLVVLIQLHRGFHPMEPFLVMWIAAPWLVQWLSHRLAPRERQYVAGQGDTLFLRGLARQTWRFFDDLMSAERHWLPPDNKQLALRIEVAERTSPTNIGLGLGSTLAAFDLGYLTADTFAARCSKTMATVEQLERYEGHLLNWYDTRTLAPLPPRYVSTVDSGNLLASLWVLAQGCDDVANACVLGMACLQGLSDTLAALARECASDSSAAVPLNELRRLFRGDVHGHELIGRLRLAAVPTQQLADTRDWQATPGDERSHWVSCLNRELKDWTSVVERYLSWMETLMQPPDSFLRILGEGAVKLRLRATESAPSLNELAERSSEPVNALLAMRRTPGLPPQISTWLEQVATEYGRAAANALQTVESLRATAESAQSLAAGMDMRFLYDPQVRLFGIGYAVGGALEFNSHYDLLASECRLASFVAIAKGDVPVDHWFALSRPRAISHGGDTLLSWSGGMFEYLMPLLFMRTFANSLLDDGCRQAVKAQIDYGRERGIPWGTSESAYSALDSNQIYQYRAFGVPGLGLKPGLEDDLVVAPYATMLAMLVDPGSAVSNLKRLSAAGLAGPIGLYESIDYGRENNPEGEFGVTVFNYMAHHHGMSLLALDNVLLKSPMQRRFHADLRIRAVESLLFERIPLSRPALHEIRTGPLLPQATFDEEPENRTFTEETAVPRTHLQGNGRYSIMSSNSGGGYSRYNGLDITRWRADATRDHWGSFIYLRDLRAGNVWATTFHPTGGHHGTLQTRFSSDRIDIERRAFGIETLTAVTVAPEDDVELRRVTVTNRTLRTRHIELTSYMELALAPHNMDRAHPVFAKLFIETECVDGRILLAHRRPRSPEDPPIWAGHLVVGAEAGALQFETDRREFLGRANSPATPQAMSADLSGSTGTVLDPIFSLRTRLTLDPRAREEITFITLAASSREAVLSLAAKYSGRETVSRTFEMAWTRAQLEFRYLGIGLAAAQRFQELAGHLLYPNPRLRPPDDRLVRNRLGQERLWAYGISGDLPILTVAISDPRHLPLARDLLLAHTYWRLQGFQADLVILNQEAPSYDRPLRMQLERLIEAHSVHTGIDRPGGVFLKDWFTMPPEDSTLILAASSVMLYGGRGSLQQQLAPGTEPAPPGVFAAAGVEEEEPSPPLPFLELPYFNGLGGFTPDGREYAIYLKAGSTTPAPWVNVMANPAFGTIVSESGLGNTWHGNSQANRLTPWHNDPVSDPQSEVIYLRDEDSGAVWTPTPLPIREQDAYRARHGQGYTVFEHNSHAIGQELTVFVPCEREGGDPVKVSRLRLRNDSSRPRRLTATYFAEWVLKTEREEQQLHVQTSWDAAASTLLAQNAWNAPYAGAIAFAAASPAAKSHSGDRAQFLGRNGSFARPAAMARSRLDNRTGAGLDPAAALQVTLRLEPGAQMDVIFLLGQAAHIDEVRTLVNRYRMPADVQAALDTTRRTWDERLGVIQVHTPALSVDFLVNRWLLYQSLSCRFWGRSATYQSGGAFGFRDQLQDSMALFYALPGVARSHILLSASRQFVEGDVQHWWHPDTGAGVRTRCSDDLVWLPYVVARYVEVTGDRGILEEEVPFIQGPPLAENEHEKLFVPAISPEIAPLWEHCRRALDHAWRLGEHGLPLFGSGDWNDGMNLVGAGGKGESAWLAWFLCSAYELFAPLLEQWKLDEAKELGHRVAALKDTIERSAWDGEWYLRGYFDNGAPLGSNVNEEAQIDSLPQSWSILAKSDRPDRAQQAMASALARLVRERDRLLLLFTPPFDHSQPTPGYIKGYPPGIRENGGQYTHGSLWLAMACADMGDAANAVKLLQLMNPVETTRGPDDVARYRGEPYAVAADVAGAPDRVGQAGWTWYTGSAGWMYRIWIEEVLGFRLRGDRLAITPVIPTEWPGYEISFRYGSATYEITVRRKTEGDLVTLEEDGRRVEGGVLPLADDGRIHRITVFVPKAPLSGTPGLLETTLLESK
jgi:cyclic beta-1,2-glucan synthetase